MVSEKTKGNFGAIIVGFFIFGIFLMVIDSGIGIIFGVGLLLFLISVIVGITAIMWSIAGTADRAVRRFTDGDER
jgi:hypothetical protein